MKAILASGTIVVCLFSSVRRVAAQEVAQDGVQDSRASGAVDTPGAQSTGAQSLAQQLSSLHYNAAQSPQCLERLAEDFVPMSNEERLVEATKDVMSPAVLFDFTAYAAITQGLHTPAEWDTHLDGFGKRLGSAYAENFIDGTITDSIAWGLHEDNRYFASGKHGVGPRLLYVLESAVMARHDDGSRTVSISSLAGAASAAFIARTWQPPSTSSAGDAAASFGFIIATYALRNGFIEFAPRFLKKFVQ
jgi:hypothetical protein